MPDPPTTIGLEGCGQVEAIGVDVPAELLNKKVAFGRDPGADTLNGSWAQYASVHHRGLLLFPDSVEYSSIASSFVNPVTVIGLSTRARRTATRLSFTLPPPLLWESSSSSTARRSERHSSTSCAARSR